MLHLKAGRMLLSRFGCVNNNNETNCQETVKSALLFCIPFLYWPAFTYPPNLWISVLVKLEQNKNRYELEQVLNYFKVWRFFLNVEFERFLLGTGISRACG
ncbi:hypothetical protein KQW18_09065 [Vibrio vulnificus]|nr:hypothetical protein [Vibrio vulnificus]